MIVDCHAHYTTTPARVADFRALQVIQHLGGHQEAPVPPVIQDAELRASIEDNQLQRMRERGIDFTIFSPRALGMDHHNCNEAANITWARYSNELIHRVCELYPMQFAGACQLPQAPGIRPGGAVIDELRRCVDELGFVAANLNPDPTGGRWADPPLFDKDWWYPLYEQLALLDVPVMIHVSGSCNPHFMPEVASHYLNGDTTAFVQLMSSTITTDFPELKFILPHGGGAVPYHWGRYRGMAQDMQLPPLEEKVLRNVFFDTCVYHQPGIDLLLRVLPARNVLFASETFGAVRAFDADAGQYFDDTRRYVENSPEVSAAQRASIYCDNALAVYPRLRRHPRFLAHAFRAVAQTTTTLA